jgi:hypothetical protein
MLINLMNYPNPHIPVVKEPLASLVTIRSRLVRFIHSMSLLPLYEFFVCHRAPNKERREIDLARIHELGF